MSTRSKLLQIISVDTLCVQFGTNYGTFFRIKVDNKHYVITAKHLAEQLTYSFTKNSELRIWAGNKFKTLSVKLVGHCPTSDISVLAPFESAPSSSLLEPNSLEHAYGEDVFFFGFPYSDKETNSLTLLNFPLPFPIIKKGIISHISDDGYLLIDGHNNPGFSGGPVVMIDQNNSRKAHVIGVISGYKHASSFISHSNLEFYKNSGIIVVSDIQFAINIIRENPIESLVES